MRGRNIVMLLGLVALLGAMTGMMARAQATGDPEANFDFPLAPDIVPANPGDFLAIETIEVTDGGLDGAPLNIEFVCVAKTAGSTVKDRDLLELRLYLDNDDGDFIGFGPDADFLLGIVRNPVLTPEFGSDCPGVRFGVPGQLLFSVEDAGLVTLFVVATFSPAAQRGDMLQLIVTMVANDDLIGAGQSSRFTNGDSSLTRTSLSTTVVEGPEVGELFVIDETASLIGTAAPGSTVVVQQFTVENRDAVPAALERITAYAEGFRDGDLDETVLAGVKRLRLFRETGRTGPGWQEGDEVLGVVYRPDLTNGALFGGNRRRLLLLQPPGEGNSVQRFYLVADLDPGMRNGDTLQFAVEVSAGFTADGEGIMVAPPKIVVASGMIEIEAPAATIAIGDVVLSSKGKVKVSVSNVPTPGLGSVIGTISFDPQIVQVAGTAQGTYRVRGLGNYLVDDVTVDNFGGTIEFLLTLKPGRKPLTGSGDIMEIEFVSAPDVNPGDQTTVDIAIEEARDANGDDLIFDEVSGTARIRIIMGDVDGNGVVTRRDATLLARWLLGRAVLTAIQKAADVDHSCPEDTDWAALEPGECVDETDVRWIKEAAAGLRTLNSGSASLQVLGRGLTVLRLPSGGVEFRALSAEHMSVQVFALSGSLVFSAETTTGVLRFEGLSNRGTRLAKGVYLYMVTLTGRDGAIWRSEVRKLIVR